MFFGNPNLHKLNNWNLQMPYKNVLDMKSDSPETIYY